jgi:hypothetical protein
VTLQTRIDSLRKAYGGKVVDAYVDAADRNVVVLDGGPAGRAGFADQDGAWVEVDLDPREQLSARTQQRLFTAGSTDEFLSGLSRAFTLAVPGSYVHQVEDDSPYPFEKTDSASATFVLPTALKYRVTVEVEPVSQSCRGCGAGFPYVADADFCPSCSAENAGVAS